MIKSLESLSWYLSRGSLCILGYSALSQAAYNSDLTFTFCLLRTSTSIRDESLGPSQVFVEQVYTTLCIVCGFLDSQEYDQAFQSL